MAIIRNKIIEYRYNAGGMFEDLFSGVNVGCLSKCDALFFSGLLAGGVVVLVAVGWE